MRLLLSNDDGINAKGIKTLAERLSKTAEVFVVAPDRERSSTGHGITVYRPLMVTEMHLCKDVVAWSISGTPADCVKLGIDELLPARPDLIISGINNGSNLSTDVLYSGTVSAAIEGVINGIPAIAVSLANNDCLEPDLVEDFSCAVGFTENMVSNFISTGMYPGVMLNINVPAGKPSGVKVTQLGLRRYVNCFEKRTNPRGKVYYWLAGEPIDVETGLLDIDSKAVKDNFISITPIHFNLTHFDEIENLNKWVKELRD
ncbi:stationary-phase survival protein SurE [Desulfofarcimen acetoxidans DSM 771]|jgi:5'-nucleotidase|uniref:5'-nucleotidase SurE n=1 Tax=Desulfofarcimen acetoxidans (strain ATCC 49208 / DSM 771 / KCTC 5769 / VKM B-1644 / 5575) TaxID=485916 RepID=C8W6F2_DESAS|nr:5'/3'-nucleotidase SurE [Desulfofarcimen acetoxidans]ACV62241.1 stationary-phase survival protein SurE [Desulfofarcimen acetoxidans DSM 771]